MKRNSWFVYIIWLSIILLAGCQGNSLEKKQLQSARTDSTTKVADEDGTVFPSPGTTDPQPSGETVTGVLLDENGLPEEGTEVLLVEAQVWNLEGNPVQKLPAEGTTIVDMGVNTTGDNIKGRSRTDASGRFEFRAAPGRYGVTAVTRGEKNAALLQSESLQRRVLFDLTTAGKMDLGNVSRK
ncbi:MAG: hypothetical protein IQL11_06450 [Bacteroidales bacterium]|nr:hypothetical protein [Bacteroidales bacterium]